MSKIICDICGTSYPDTAGSCPICGCSKDAAMDLLGEDFAAEEVAEETKVKVAPNKKKEIFDFDEVNSELIDDTIDENNPYSEEEESEYEERKGHNVVVVIILTILIFALLAAAGFIFVRYFLPNMKGEDAAVPTTEAYVQETEAPTTEATIPCEMLILESGTAELTKEGQMFLLHVKPSPEDTTDKIVYTSGDENVAVVTEDGRITAVGEGETVIYITCGNVQTTCPVVVSYVEVVETTEATVPEETESESEDDASEEANESDETEETKAPVRTDVTLKLKQEDISLGVYYQHQLMLDCDLEQNEVEWVSEHPHIVKVDEEGNITALKDGTTSVIAKYGDQEVSCIVRCSY